MARERSPNREKAFQLWSESGGTRMLKDIATSLGVSDALIRKWKKADNWDGLTNGYVTNANSHVTDDSNGHVTVGHETEKRKSQRGKGAPKGNQYAKGNRGGAAPTGNTNAVKHGLFRKFLPDDEETREIYDNVSQANPLDLLWESIQIKFTAIVRAQRIMFVRDQEDQTKVLKKFKPGMFGEELEWELQHAWDKQASFLQAQARAMGTLTSMIRQYEEMCRLGFADEEQLLRIQKLKLEVGSLRGDTDGDAHKQNSGYEDALNAQAADVFADEVNSDDQET